MTDSNYIKNVAITGATGHLGAAFTTALLATNNHTITALTRPDSKSTFPSALNVVKVDYADHPTLVQAFKSANIDFLIITLSIYAAPETHSQLVKAAVEAGVKYIMPNVYGMDITNQSLAKESLYGDRGQQIINEVTALGAKAVVMCCGMWFEWSLALGEQWFGFDIANRKAVFMDDGKTRISSSTWEQCGRGVAALLSLPVKRINGTEEGMCVEDWTRKQLYVGSFYVCQRDMLDSLNRVLGTTDGDWEVRYEGSKERYRVGLEELQSGNRLGLAKAMYSRVFYQNGDGDVNDKLDNEILGLPKEDMDESVKRAIEMVEGGFRAKVFGPSGP